MSLNKLKAALLFAAIFASSTVFSQDSGDTLSSDESSDASQPAEADTPADETVPADSAEIDSTNESAEEDKAAQVAANVRKFLGDFEITSVSESPIPGVYELVSGGTILYVNEAGTLLIEGDMIDLEQRVSLTEQKLGKLHMTMIATMPESEMLVYEPEIPTGRSITVFTDISCGYCQRLHQEIDTLLDAGVAVRYLMFPRAGLNTPAADALESVWCNDDPQAAMTAAKSGGRVPPKSCDNPIGDHVALAERVGLRGTPLIYLDTGDRIPGYRDAATIVDMVKSKEKFVP